MDTTMLLLNLVVDGVTLGCVYALLAVGFSLLWWIAGIMHVAHGAVMLAGGFAVYASFAIAGTGLPLSLVAGGVVAIGLGVAFETFLYRPLHRRRTDEMGILTASLGALIFVEYVATIVFGPDGAALDAGALRSPLFGSSILIDGFSVMIVGVTFGLFLCLGVILTRTRIGREMRAMASNADLAVVLGVNTSAVNAAAAAIAAALCLPAAAFLLFNTGLVPTEALHIVLVASVVAILGGRGSIVGALIAGLIIGIAESAMTWRFSAGWRQLITFSLLYVLLLFRPQGIFGERA